jgi:5-methylcytosine-specific restriction endonuclease McrA
MGMARKQGSAPEVRRISEALMDLADRIDDTGTTREELDEFVAELYGVQRVRFGPRPNAKGGEGAKHKILEFLVAHVGEEVYGEQLHAVSGGIGEWARRVRELRGEDGYDIAEIGASVYVLQSPGPDQERATKWQLANSIRKRKGSAKSRIEAYFEATVGQPVTGEQLDYVARIKEGVRRARELRDEFGWPINSHIEEPELGPGGYRLLSTDSDDRRDISQRLYPDELRSRVFERDSYTCAECGRNREQALAEGDTRFYLEVHHKIAVADELAELPSAERNNIENLITLCHRDHVRETASLQRRKRSSRPSPEGHRGPRHVDTRRSG